VFDAAVEKYVNGLVIDERSKEAVRFSTNASG
jgi:hypothetical protein